jgi:L-ribulose-5-phosphate 4-epimerase
MYHVKYEYKEIVAQATYKFWKNELTGGGDGGDISLLDTVDNLIYILPRPNKYLSIPDWSVIRPDHVVVMDREGNMIEDNGLLPTVEWPTHVHIYNARKDAKAIVHSHGQWSSVFAITGKSIPVCLAEQALFLGGETVCAEYGLVGSQDLGEKIVAALGKTRSTALMRNHGAVAIGSSLEDALTKAILLEKGAQTTIFGSLIGKPIVLEMDNILDDCLLDENGNPNF